MQIKINLKTYSIFEIHQRARSKLHQRQTQYTQDRDAYISNYIKDNKKSFGFFWWKTYSDLTRDEAINLLGASEHGYVWQIHYYREVLNNKHTKFYNRILSIHHYLDSLELILTDEEYDCLFN